MKGACNNTDQIFFFCRECSTHLSERNHIKWLISNLHLLCKTNCRTMTWRAKIAKVQPLPQKIDWLGFNDTFSTVRLYWLIELEFNGTFSTVRLYRALKNLELRLQISVPLYWNTLTGWRQEKFQTVKMYCDSIFFVL